MRKYNYKTLNVTRYMLHDKKGFTLIELIIAIAIMGIMFAITVPSYVKYRDSKSLFLGAEQVVGDIRMVQNYAYSILKDNGSFPVGGYGIHFSKDSNHYIIFADKDDDSMYDIGEEFEEVDLPKNIKIKSLKKINNSTDPITITSLGSINLVFKPPYGKVNIDGDEKLGGKFIGLKIEIENPSDSTKTIEISSSRLVN